MHEPDGPRLLRAGCACGWETIGDVESTVAATIDHGQRVHNMTATRDQVMAGAEWVEPAGEEEPA
jgi:hypothetical protein